MVCGPVTHHSVVLIVVASGLLVNGMTCSTFSCSISAWASEGDIFISTIILHNLRLVVLQLVEGVSAAVSSTVALTSTALAHVIALRGNRRADLLRTTVKGSFLGGLRALGTRMRDLSNPVIVDLVFIKTADLVEKTLLSTHGRSVLSRSINCSALCFLRACICIVPFLVTAEAYNALMDKTVFWVLSLDLLDL